MSAGAETSTGTGTGLQTVGRGLVRAAAVTGAIVWQLACWSLAFAARLVAFALGLAVALLLLVIGVAWNLLTSGMRSAPRWKTDGFGGVRRRR